MNLAKKLFYIIGDFIIFLYSLLKLILDVGDMSDFEFVFFLGLCSLVDLIRRIYTYKKAK